VNIQVNGPKFQDLIHRIVYICDEFIKEDDIQIIENHKDKTEIMKCLKYFCDQSYTSKVNMELKSLCGQFISE
jgi:hypothetical protein